MSPFAKINARRRARKRRESAHYKLWCTARKLTSFADYRLHESADRWQHWNVTIIAVVAVVVVVVVVVVVAVTAIAIT